MATALQAVDRKDLRGSRLNNIRQSGGIPGILYGKATESTPVTVDEIEFIKTYRKVGKTGVFKLDKDGKKYDVMIYDMQVDHIKNQVTHIDFYAVDMKSELDADIPVNLTGEAQGAKDGGVVQLATYELSVRALPANLPDSIDLDVTNLEINDSIQVKDIKGVGDFEFNNDPEEVVVSVLPPTEEPEEQEAPAGDEGSEPELVGADEEGEEEESK
ncbi:50S ribosomal protein L25/general stress protein Ctc [Alteribacter natronophilus]|uniref:50S ribosomal protein L25/general stress protein Ctc n=1 Tax=Alteribacter natronophilus TaxID=2583810 RepID=UPI00110D6E1A|nr:50S ribosomal protein L25/general stress protein Ctc [Alteribacter natronophilus]TMW69956.1 50S ribosomal protein L25/general stress protein Ctc [Alteribacter natronophilus]